MAKKKQTPPNAEVFEIVWTEEAQQALWNVWAWLAEHNEEKADALYEELRDKVALLAKHPLLGPLMPVSVASLCSATGRFQTLQSDKSDRTGHTKRLHPHHPPNTDASRDVV